MNKILCHYGCGKEAEYYFPTVDKYCCSSDWTQCSIMRLKKSRILKGRVSPMLGKKHLEETKRKIGNSKIGKQRDESTRRKLSEFRKGKKYEELMGVEKSIEQKLLKRNQLLKNNRFEYLNSFPRSLEKMKIKSEKDRRRLLSGQAAYMNSFIKNPSKPQVELYNRVKQIYSSAILNYPFLDLNFTVDIAIPDLKIIIESDGSWWHQDKEKDLERQRKIEQLGWKFIRYKADFIKNIPSAEKVSEDIKNVR